MDVGEVESRLSRYLESQGAPVALDALYADALEGGAEPREIHKALRDLMVGGRVDQFSRHYAEGGSFCVKVLWATREYAESFSRGRVPTVG